MKDYPSNTFIIDFIVRVTRPFYWLVSGLVLVAFFDSLDISLRPYLMKVMLDKIPGINHSTTFEVLLPPAMYYLIMSIVMLISYQFYNWIILKLEPRLRKEIEATLVDHVMDHSHHFYLNNLSSGITNKINAVADGVVNMLTKSIDQFLGHILSLTIAFYTLWQIKPRFAIAFFIWTVFFLIVSFLFSRKAVKLADKTTHIKSVVVSKTVDILNNMSNIRLFGRKKYETAYLKSSFDPYINAFQTRDYFFMKLFGLQGGSFIILQSVCLWWLIAGLQTQSVTAGDFALILAINMSIVGNLWYISADISEFSRALGDITQGLRVIYTPLEVVDEPNAPALAVKSGEIIFENVDFHYKNADFLFKNKSLVIPGGQKVGLVGYSGCGKSTFVNLVLRLFEVTSGRILIDGQDIKKVNQQSLRNSIAIISQEPSFFNRPLIENIRYGRIEATDEEVIIAAKQAHAHEFIEKLPQGYQSYVGDRSAQLSGGQRQRIAIARAFLQNTPILILDEATSQLDHVSEKKIQESINQLMIDKTTLVIAHRFSTLLHMDRILVFHEGVIVGDGKHADLLHTCPRYKQLWQAQVHDFVSDTPVDSFPQPTISEPL